MGSQREQPLASKCPGGAGIGQFSLHRYQKLLREDQGHSHRQSCVSSSSLTGSCSLLTAHSPSDDIKGRGRGKAPMLPPRCRTHKTERRGNDSCFNETLPAHLVPVPHPICTHAPLAPWNPFHSGCRKQDSVNCPLVHSHPTKRSLTESKSIFQNDCYCTGNLMESHGHFSFDKKRERERDGGGGVAKGRKECPPPAQGAPVSPPAVMAKSL